ncbi:MAG TPA: hypothetical protein PKH77_01885 [Anaerolineae bacterium]|nr:hypothetical protein [Anaerolineae bacterium]
MSELDLLEEFFKETQTEVETVDNSPIIESPQQEEVTTSRRSTFRAFPKIEATKENCKKWHHKGKPAAKATLIFSREAPFIELLNKKLAVISNEGGRGYLTGAINDAFCLAVDLLYDQIADFRGYKDAYLRGEEIPETWLQVMLEEQATMQKLQEAKFNEDLTNIWHPTFVRLGFEEFTNQFGQHPAYAQIIEHCQKKAPLAMVQSEEGYTLTAKIKNYLAEWSKEQSVVSYKDIEETLLNEAILPGKDDVEAFQKAKSVLKGIGSTLDLPIKGQRGFWNIGKLQES